MANAKRKILLIVEGEKTDVVLMKHLFSVYEIDVKYEIISYCTNIYTLYQELFSENDPDSIDLLQLLKEREQNPQRKIIFDTHYSDILLIFDFDPQAPDFTPEKIKRMVEYFIESSDMGKLYLNYPMVEAFYHMSSIPDLYFDSRFATLTELSAGTYKTRVNRENRNHDYRKFAVTKEECDIVILQNLRKAQKLMNISTFEEINTLQQSLVLTVQLNLLYTENRVAVLSTCPCFIPEYNPKLIDICKLNL